ncbi:MAG TPA: poly-beta-1,6-N-acetyl-D-glucosamine biosynthesis protein PgaD [Moraxellaceae bacterium]
MSDSLIINARQHLRWHERLFSDASTAMLWGVWLWLWRPVLSTVNWLAALGASFQPTLMKLLANGSPLNIEGGVVALVGTSGTLLLWNLLPARKAEAPQVHTLRDYAGHFQLPEQDILAGRASSVCVVHHDEQGRIVRIEQRA